MKHYFLDRKAERTYLKNGMDADDDFQLLEALTRLRDDNLITGHNDQRVRLWDLESGEKLSTPSSHLLKHKFHT